MSQQLRPPRPVKLIVGMLSGQVELFDWAERAMSAWWGPVDIASEVIDFTWTNYYAQEMGDTLLRKFLSFERPIRPEEISQCKHQSNELERLCAESSACGAHKASRPVNLDPGYIEPSKLVLVTTKNYSHRVYIGNDMYAEPTLHFHKGQWHSWPFTYPDYGSGRYDGFLSAARERLTEQLKSQS